MPAEESPRDEHRDLPADPLGELGAGWPTGRVARRGRPLRATRSLRPGNRPVEPLPPSDAPPPRSAAARPAAAARRAAASPVAASPVVDRPDADRADPSRLKPPREIPRRTDPPRSHSARPEQPTQSIDRVPRVAERPSRLDPPTPQRTQGPGLIEEADDTPLQNVPLLTRQLGRWTVEGYSRAAVQSYWRISEMKIGFDAGAHPWDFMSLPRLFITHSHLDHIAALPAYVARRRMMKMDPPVIYLPKSAVDPVAALLRVFTQLDRGRLPCELIGLQPGDTVELTREYAVTATPTRHTVPSLGYVVWERRKKLKPEFQVLSGDEIRDIRLSGTEVSAEVRLPVVAYTGDTAPAGLDDSPDMYDAEVLITEMTFVSPSHRREKIHKHGHTHLDDFVARLDRFNNQYIVCGHFSTRYSDSRIERWLRKSLPDLLGGRLIPWLDLKNA